MLADKPSLKSDLDLDKARAMLMMMCPESAIFHFIVLPGEPYSKARPKFNRRGVAYNTQKQKVNEAKIAWELRKHFHAPYDKNLSVGCIFFRSSKQRIDVDNMLKNVMDAANKIVYIDDCQVTAKFGMIELDKENPRTVIMIGTHESSMVRDLNKQKVCSYCKKEYSVAEASHAGKSKFCSRICSSRSIQKHFLSEVTCPTCKTTYKRRTAGQIYCSTTCRNKAISAVKKDKGKKKVHTCKSCGEPVSRAEYVRCRKCWKNDFKRTVDTPTKAESNFRSR